MNKSESFETKDEKEGYFGVASCLRACARPGMRILEVGEVSCLAELALEGFHTEADALSSGPGGLEKPEVFKCGLSGLGLIGGGSFDMTLALEPMLCLQTYADKRKAISEVFRVTKPEGLIFLAFNIKTKQGGELLLARVRAEEPEKDSPHGEGGVRKNSPLMAAYCRACKEEAGKLMSGFPAVCLRLASAGSPRLALLKASEAADDKLYGKNAECPFLACGRREPAGAAQGCVGVFKKTPPLRLKYVDY